MKRFKSLLTGHSYGMTDMDVELYQGMILMAKKSQRINGIEYKRFQDTLLKIFGARCCITHK
jgi:hypothetical protein